MELNGEGGDAELQPFQERAEGDGGQVGMVQEGDAARFEDAREFLDVAFHDIGFGMDQGIKGKGEVDGSGADHWERRAVVDAEIDMGKLSKSINASAHAGRRKVDADQGFAVTCQELCPAAMARGNLKDAAMQERKNPGEQATEPLSPRRSPKLRPLVSILGPCTL